MVPNNYGTFLTNAGGYPMLSNPTHRWSLPYNLLLGLATEPKRLSIGRKRLISEQCSTLLVLTTQLGVVLIVEMLHHCGSLLYHQLHCIIK